MSFVFAMSPHSNHISRASRGLHNTITNCATGRSLGSARPCSAPRVVTTASLEIKTWRSLNAYRGGGGGGRESEGR